MADAVTFAEVSTRTTYEDTCDLPGPSTDREFDATQTRGSQPHQPQNSTWTIGSLESLKTKIYEIEEALRNREEVAISALREMVSEDRVGKNSMSQTFTSQRRVFSDSNGHAMGSSPQQAEREVPKRELRSRKEEPKKKGPSPKVHKARASTSKVTIPRRTPSKRVSPPATAHIEKAKKPYDAFRGMLKALLGETLDGFMKGKSFSSKAAALWKGLSQGEKDAYGSMAEVKQRALLVAIIEEKQVRKERKAPAAKQKTKPVIERVQRPRRDVGEKKLK